MTMNLKELLFTANQKLHQGDFREAETLFSEMLKRDPKSVDAIWGRARARWSIQAFDAAIGDYAEAHFHDPCHEFILQEYVSALVKRQREEEALKVCDEAIKKAPKNISAHIGRDWVTSLIAPIWHIPMVNEKQRNQAYFDGIVAANFKEDELVFEIGAGSGLLSMMAARQGAGFVVACEAKRSVAKVAEKVIESNRLGNRIRIVNKSSHQVALGADLERRADVLLHEIFSSELLGEHVLPSIEDAKARLLKEEAKIIPPSASIMIGLVGSKALKNYLFASETFGFDLTELNKVSLQKVPIYREDLDLILMSDAHEAFAFDFQSKSHFPPESKVFQMASTREGECLGVVQWIKINFDSGIVYQNHPANKIGVTGWERLIFKFKSPISMVKGETVEIQGSHNRERIWFDLLSHKP